MCAKLCFPSFLPIGWRWSKLIKKTVDWSSRQALVKSGQVTVTAFQVRLVGIK
jgi:hypothetical protein